MVDFFFALYHPQDVQDEKVSLALAPWEHGEIKTLGPSKICWIHEKSVELMESQRNRDGIATECHLDKTLTKNLSEIRHDSVAIPSILSQFHRVFHVPSVLGPN